MKRSHWILAVAASLLVAGWCSWWFYASHQAQLGASKLVADFSSRGTKIHCGDPAWSGFPFRISLDCTPFSVTSAASSDHRALAFPHLGFTAQAFNLRRILAVSDTPAMWTDHRGGTHVVTHTTALASFVRGEVDELNIATQELKVESVLSAGSLDIHLSRHAHNGKSEIRFVIEGADLKLDMPVMSEMPVDRFSAAGTLQTGQTIQLISPEMLHAVELNGAALDFADLAVQQADLRITGNGHLQLDETSRLDGKIALTVENIGSLLQRLKDLGLISSSEASGGIALLTLFAGIDGKVKIDLSADHGDIYLGPLKLGTFLPPVNE